MHTYVHCGAAYNSKDLETTQIPINDRLDRKNVALIHQGILCSHKNNEFVSFVGTWMNVKTITLSKLTQEQKIKHCMFSLIGRWWTMRTHGHREGSITHSDLLGGTRGELGEGQQWVGRVRRDNMGWNTRYRWQGMEAANHIAMYVPMQQSCTICTCTPEPKVQ